MLQSTPQKLLRKTLSATSDSHLSHQALLQFITNDSGQESCSSLSFSPELRKSPPELIKQDDSTVKTGRCSPLTHENPRCKLGTCSLSKKTFKTLMSRESAQRTRYATQIEAGYRFTEICGSQKAPLRTHNGITTFAEPVHLPFSCSSSISNGFRPNSPTSLKCDARILSTFLFFVARHVCPIRPPIFGPFSSILRRSGGD